MSSNEKSQKMEETCLESGFFSEFPTPDYEEWKEAAVASLKGAPFEKKVFTKTYEEIELQPIYRQEDVQNLPHQGSLPGFPPYVRGTEPAGFIFKPWDISQELSCSTPEEFNAAALHDLNKGQTALNIVLDQPTRQGLDPDQAEAGQVGYKGVSLSSLADMKTALDGVNLSATPLFVETGSTAVPFAALAAALADSRGESASNLKGCIGADPLGELALNGTLPLDLSTSYDSMAALGGWAAQNAPDLKTILVSGRPYHDAGSSAVQELGYALASGVEYIRALQDRGLEIDDIAGQMIFSFSIGSNFFMEIAKLRAARIIWTTVIEAFGGDEQSQKMLIHGRTSAYTKTAYDPYVNMLRNTTEAFAGAMGGVNSMHVSLFDEPVRTPDEFSRRVSRNVQIILQKECHFTHPIDPAGGSWYLEVLTDQVAQKAWALFQDVEKSGGMFKALTGGEPQKAVAAVAAKKEAALNTRKDSLIGTNKYPNLQETPLQDKEIDYQALYKARADESAKFKNARQGSVSWPGFSGSKPSASSFAEAIRAALAGAALGELAGAMKSGAELPQAEKISIRRASEKYETLRKNAEKILEATGKRIKVFLANMGPIPQHKARADFTVGFFEVGGFEVINNTGFGSVDDAAEAALDSQAPIVVICSTDKTYPELVPPLVKLIKESKPDVTVILAGKPAADHEAAYLEAGLDDSIHIRANCYEMLDRFQKKIGLSEGSE